MQTHRRTNQTTPLKRAAVAIIVIVTPCLSTNYHGYGLALAHPPVELFNVSVHFWWDSKMQD